MQSGRKAPGAQSSVGLFLHGARDGRHRGRLRLQALILQTLVAIVFPVVHSGTVEGPFIMYSYARMYVVLVTFHESRPRTVAR